MSGPRPKKAKNPVVDPTTALSLVLNSSAITGIEGLNIAEAKGLSRDMSAMTAILAYLLFLLQFLGFSGSYSSKSINCYTLISSIVLNSEVEVCFLASVELITNGLQKE